jgi:hypothetical protein
MSPKLKDIFDRLNLVIGYTNLSNENKDSFCDYVIDYVNHLKSKIK